ncbi:MAG: type II toxin-antitoxin system Phd/YefM family antitoxin [Chloroflexi bacterium]|nr:type II toxin-antitoxin system Phd/YefM family antitoxin [Chloroflexota bacterium]
MREQEPTTQTMKASDARQNWSQVLNQVFRGETRVLVEKSGIPVAAIISAEDFQRLSRFDEQRRQEFKALFATQAAFQDVPDDELEQEITRALAEVRRQRRRQPSNSA